MNRQELFQEAIKRYGADSQLNVAIEEMSELIKELCKMKRYGDQYDVQKVIEEIADVEIMLEQVLMLFKLQQGDIDLYKTAKLQRLADRLGVAFSG